MTNILAIRSYNSITKGHKHPFAQLVLPLRGVINIALGAFTGKVTPGECVVVKSGQIHHFNADPQARFVVADMDLLPPSLASTNTPVFAISAPLLHFLGFVEQQLNYQVNKPMEALMFSTFYQLLSEQRLLKQIEPRIREVLAHIEANLPKTLAISDLAKIACLSPTQFKKVFKQQTQQTLTQYLTKLRMEKAQALLLHTDYPMQIIAETVGYRDATAFSRRFSQYFGLPPSKFTR